jgi:hypothetical protein
MSEDTAPVAPAPSSTAQQLAAHITARRDALPGVHPSPDDSKVGGQTLNRTQLQSLPFDVAELRTSTASARLLADNYHAANPEAPVDSRYFRARGEFDQRATAIREQLTSWGIGRAMPNTLADELHRAAVGHAAVGDAANGIRRRHPEWFGDGDAPRTADRVARNGLTRPIQPGN